MEKLKYYGTFIVLVIAFYIFSSVIIYIHLHPQEVGGKIYNITHKTEQVNKVK